jgi:hypothetical protein
VDATYLQSGNSSFQQNFRALVTDAAGNPQSGVPVIFSVPTNSATPGASFQGDGAVSLSGQSYITETTDNTGVATVPTTNRLVANGTAGQFMMTATPETAVALTSATWTALPNNPTGGTITFTTPAAVAIAAGSKVTIGGITSNGPGNYNGVFTVTSVRGSQFTVGSANAPLPNPGTATLNLAIVDIPLQGYRAGTISLTNTPGAPDASGIKVSIVPLATSFGILYNLQVTVADKHGNIIPNVAVGLTINSPDGVFFSNNFDTTSAAVTNKKGVATVPIQVVNGRRNIPFDLNLTIDVALPGGGSIAVQKTVSNVIVK